MISKRILVLANSIQHRGLRCVAGRELIAEKTGQIRWGGWIRPVSTHDEGALNVGEQRLADAADPEPLDVVQVPLNATENRPLQPENWLIHTGQAWTKESYFDTQVLLPLVEEPDSLWMDPVQKNDWASATVLQRLPNFQSLYLIRPEAFHFQVRPKVGEESSEKQVRGLFTYKGRPYDFALADPLIGKKYFPDFPRTPEGDIRPRDGRPILLCVSLTPPFRELPYKIIATVLELPA
jgi:hypothetical protein